MHTINLFASAVKSMGAAPTLPCEPIPGTCCLTGDKGLCIQRSELIGDNFTQAGLFRRPDSPMIGVDAYTAWMYGYYTAEGKKREYRPERMACWWTDGTELRLVSRQDVRALVLDPEPISNPWAGYVTTSYKKHGTLVSPINVAWQRVWGFETQKADCSDLRKVRDWWDHLNAALEAGFGRTILETLDCPAYVMGRAGGKEWVEFDRWARPKRHSALYQFLCYLLPSKAEMDAISGEVSAVAGEPREAAVEQLNLGI